VIANALRLRKTPLNDNVDLARILNLVLQTNF